MTDCVVGIDLGTSLVKAGVYTIEGALLGSASAPLAMHQGAGGRVEQSMTDFSMAAAIATRQSLDHADVDMHRITALAIAGQMAGVGLVDRRHRPVAPFDSWLDTRCAPVVDELAAAYGDRIVAGSGCPPTISIGPKMVWWHRAEPKGLQRRRNLRHRRRRRRVGHRRSDQDSGWGCLGRPPRSHRLRKPPAVL